MYSRREYSRDRYSADTSITTYSRAAETRRLDYRRHHHPRHEYSREYEVDDRHEDWYAGRPENYRFHDHRYYHSRDRYTVKAEDHLHHRSHALSEEATNRETCRAQYSQNESLANLAGPSKFLAPRQLRSESPPPVPIPSSPSDEYLRIASEPSETVPFPLRKLIILDLNGTLLVRVRSLGIIHPRPFMATFRDFLFSPATRQWLDIMVWSSAQPHNVERMVRRCFFDARLGPMPRDPGAEETEVSELTGKEDDGWHGKLIALWARDTLGLSRTDYSRKSQTTKDLDKPWSTLTGNHNARTTVLLDDSPRKARLQPYNHVCVGEYSMQERDHDVTLKRLVLEREKLSESPAKVEDGHAEGKKREDRPLTTQVHGDKTEILTEKEKARKLRKAEKNKRLREKIDAELAQDSEYDSVLLAIIGILDALKRESNVAGWIRAGGLWAGKTPPPIESITERKSASLEDTGYRAPSPTDPEVGEEGDQKRPLSPTAKRQRSLGAEIPGSVGGDTKRTRLFGNGALAEEEALVVTGNDAQTLGAVTGSRKTSAGRAEGGVTSNEDDAINDEKTRVKMWFEDRETYQAWVNRGRAALKRLGIEERDGIHID